MAVPKPTSKVRLPRFKHRAFVIDVFPVLVPIRGEEHFGVLAVVAISPSQIEKRSKRLRAQRSYEKEHEKVPILFTNRRCADVEVPKVSQVLALISNPLGGKNYSA